MKKYIGLFFASMMMCSCVDTIILPYDKTVEEDFWQTKSEVRQMVNGAYQSMLNSDLIARLIVWGDFRSDELVTADVPSSGILTALQQIQTGNIETTNTYADWAPFYAVINNCSVVLEKAGNVRNIDPNYTDGDYLADRSQMLTLRALCYFYLVRAFRDVPYQEKAIVNSSQEMTIGQSSPAVVLQKCIDDLEEAEKNAISSNAYNNWRRVGYINKDAVQALLADIYLWRASVTHSASDYQKCVSYCDAVIASKKGNHMDEGQDDKALKGFPLADGKTTFNSLFIDQNAEESIFELQFEGENNSNDAVCQMYHTYKKNTEPGYMQASTIFSAAGGSGVFSSPYDLRLRDCRFAVSAGSEAQSYKVRKFIENQTREESNPNGASFYPKVGVRTTEKFAQNFIIYRLSDVLLMKAEALTQLSPDDAEASASDEEKSAVSDQQKAYLNEALSLVQAVSNRSRFEYNDTTLKWGSKKSDMETFVLQERQRELCFEGKRWFDMMRYNYRHMTGVQYDKTLNELDGNYVKNYDAMLDLMERKGTGMLKSKTQTEPYLYMPVLESQIKVNDNLKQNPAYKSKGFVKN